MALYELESVLSTAARVAQRCGPHYAPRVLAYLDEAQQLVSRSTSLVAEEDERALGLPRQLGTLAMSLQTSVSSTFLQALSLINVVVQRLQEVVGDHPDVHVATSRGGSQSASRNAPSSTSSSTGPRYSKTVARNNAGHGNMFISPAQQQRHQLRDFDLESIISSSVLENGPNRHLGDDFGGASVASQSVAGGGVFRNGTPSLPPPERKGGGSSVSVLSTLKPQALVDFVGSGVQLMERVCECSERVLRDRKLALRRSPNCSGTTIAQMSNVIDPSLEIIRVILQNEDNARFWSRHFGLKSYMTSTMEFCDKLIAETNHISDSTARGQVISDLVLNVIDLNGDASVDVVELALVLPAKSVVAAVEQHVQLLIASQQAAKSRAAAADGGSDDGSGGSNCERCRLVEAELVMKSREVAQLQEKIRELRVIAKASGATAIIQRLESEVDALRNENAQLRDALLVASSNDIRHGGKGSTSYHQRSQDAVARSKAILESDRLRRVIAQQQQQQQLPFSSGAGGYLSSSSTYEYSISDPDEYVRRGQSYSLPQNSTIGGVLNVLEPDVASSWTDAAAADTPVYADMNRVSSWSATPTTSDFHLTRLQRETSRNLDSILHQTIEQAKNPPPLRDTTTPPPERFTPLPSSRDVDESSTVGASGSSKKSKNKHRSKSKETAVAAVDTEVIPPPPPTEPLEPGRAASTTETRSTTPPPGPRVRKVENFL